MPSSRSGGVADVPESTIRSVASWSATSGWSDACSKMRRHTAGMALNRSARQRATASQSATASACSTNTAVVCCCQAAIAIVQAPTGATYRFIFANEEATKGLDHAASLTVSSFQKLDQQALARLRPLSIKIVKARPGDTQATLAAQMRGVNRPQELFRVLNDFDPGAPVPAGTRVKVVTD